MEQNCSGAAAPYIFTRVRICLKNLLRRKIRTLLTVIGIAIGVAAIIGLGALADGLQSGYGSMLKGTKADLILSQPDAFDLSYSTVDEAIGKELLNAPEVSSSQRDDPRLYPGRRQSLLLCLRSRR